MQCNSSSNQWYDTLLLYRRLFGSKEMSNFIPMKTSAGAFVRWDNKSQMFIRELSFPNRFIYRCAFLFYDKTKGHRTAVVNHNNKNIRHYRHSYLSRRLLWWQQHWETIKSFHHSQETDRLGLPVGRRLQYRYTTYKKWVVKKRKVEKRGERSNQRYALRATQVGTSPHWTWMIDGRYGLVYVWCTLVQYMKMLSRITKKWSRNSTLL